MNFNRHSNLEGKHAIIGASKHSWVNYDEEKFIEYYNKVLATERGTRLHELAARLINERVMLPRTGQTLNRYVNDAIGFNMKPEQVLFYSYNCFGTADALAFDEKNSILRVHDLKTGTSKVSMDQLKIYNSLFCLEYDVDPNDIQIENRIYQNDDVLIEVPDVDDIFHIMDKIILFDKIASQLKLEGE